MATSFSGGGSRSSRREPPTMGKQLVNFYHLRLKTGGHDIAEILLKVALKYQKSKSINQTLLI
jgi:hypothetical protein